MKSSKFIPVAKFRENLIHAPEDGFISFFNSPYYSHKNMTGIDIYPGNLTYGDAFSPVRGRVCAIRSFRGHSSLSNASELEYLILVENEENPEIHTKLLHVKPAVQEGDYIKIGDKIGEYIRSFFFARWTDPHLHAEFRVKKDAIRARGAFKLTPCQPLLESGRYKEAPLKGKVVGYTSNYIIFEINEDLFSKQKLGGVKVGIETKDEKDLLTGIIDAGIPYFGQGGIFTKEVHKISPDDVVKVNGISIGKVVKANPINNYVSFRPTSFHICWKERTFKGISCRLSLKKRVIKVISNPRYLFQHRIDEEGIIDVIL